MYGISSEFMCCGMRTEQTNHAWLHFYQTLTEEATRGCLRADHQGKNDKPRTASDMILFAAHNKSKIAPYVPHAQLKDLGPLTLHQVRAEGGDMPIDIHVPHGTVTKNIAPMLDALICEAYEDMTFVRDIGGPLYNRIMQHREKNASKNVVFPEDKDESAFYRMTDDEFVTFHLIHDTVYNAVLPVRVMALRRAARDMDPDVLKQIKQDKQKRD